MTTNGGRRENGGAMRTRRGRVVALTGATSFLGRGMLAALEEDPEVAGIVALDVRRPIAAGRKTRFYEIDLTQPGVDARLAEIFGAEHVDVLVHLAFLSRPTHAAAWAHELESVGTMHLLHALRERPVAKLIVRSQTLLYGAHPSNPGYLPESRPLLDVKGTGFLRDKVQAENEVRGFAHQQPDTCVTVLRFAPILGPHVTNYVTRWLSRRLVPTVMGFDPLLQFVHELDALCALKLAIDLDAPGVFNIVGAGALPVSKVVKLAGRMAIPLPYSIATRASALLWATQLDDLPPAFLMFLRFLCLADGARAREELGFEAVFSSREAVLDFGGALHLRDARLLSEAS